MDRLRTGVSAPTFGQLSEKLEAPAAQGACDEGVENVVLPITATGLACEGTRSITANVAGSGRGCARQPSQGRDFG